MTVSTQAFRWTEKYAVNIASLDDQHRGLFTTINELNDALATGEGRAAADAILKKLVDYAITHFASEEELMTRHDFPGLPRHRGEHENFRQRVAQFVEEYKAGKPGVPVALLFFLQSWLKEHILKTDKAYSAFLNARGVR